MKSQRKFQENFLSEQKKFSLSFFLLLLFSLTSFGLAENFIIFSLFRFVLLVSHWPQLGCGEDDVESGFGKTRARRWGKEKETHFAKFLCKSSSAWKESSWWRHQVMGKGTHDVIITNNHNDKRTEREEEGKVLLGSLWLRHQKKGNGDQWRHHYESCLIRKRKRWEMNCLLWNDDIIRGIVQRDRWRHRHCHLPPLFFLFWKVSRTRLSVRNLPASVDDAQLRELFFEAAKSVPGKNRPRIVQAKLQKDPERKNKSKVKKKIPKNITKKGIIEF